MPAEQVFTARARHVVALGCPGDPALLIGVRKQCKGLNAVACAKPSNRAVCKGGHDPSAIRGYIHLPGRCGCDRPPGQAAISLVEAHIKAGTQNESSAGSDYRHAGRGFTVRQGQGSAIEFGRRAVCPVRNLNVCTTRPCRGPRGRRGDPGRPAQVKSQCGRA